MTDPTPASDRPLHAVILCHPDPKSFNAAIARRYCEAVQTLGHRVEVRDLYGSGFDPVLKGDERPDQNDYALPEDIAREVDAISPADIIVLVYPIWFAMPPAMLIGYVDRVLGAGFSAEALRRGENHSFLAGKRLLSFSTSGTSRQWLEEQGAWLSLRNLFDDYIKRVFSLKSAEHIHFAPITEGMKPRFAEEHLFEVEQTARKMCSQFL